MKENGIWSEDQSCILQVFSTEFCRRFKRDLNVNICQPILLSRSISTSNNEWLTRDLTEDKVWQAVKQIGSLKALGPNYMHAIFLLEMLEIIGKIIYA